MSKLSCAIRKSIPVLIFVIAFIALVTVVLILSSPLFGNQISAAEKLGGLDAENPSETDSPQFGISNPDREIRGIWIASVANLNYPSEKGLTEDKLKKELDTIVENCAELGLNTIFFQVRPSSDALYKSDIFPASEYVSGTQGEGSFDSLNYLITVAHEKRIDVHAWVNPLRVTGAGSDAYNKKDLSLLSETNPARQHPEWIFTYNGLTYYNAGIPEVRNLVADGVAEIVRNYDVDGIVFDDYFYPYPADGQTLDADSETYLKYGSQFSSIGDFRRDNVNKMVEQCYNTVKSIYSDCLFGIAPFGIWQNDDGENGGSDTRGFEAYNEIYCDALEWINGEYIDYIAPQIYWQFTTSSARFDTLVRWWNQQLEEHENISLLVCHAAYRSNEWGTVNEIRNQVEFSRSERSYRGSVMYGYVAIEADDMELKNQLKKLYENEIVYTDILSTGEKLKISSPAYGSYINSEYTYIIGSSDPKYPVYFDEKPISRTKGGYFSLYLPLAEGENKFIFSQNGEDTEYCINRGTAPVSQSTGYDTLDSFTLTSLRPMYDCMLPKGTKITLYATAPSGSRVTAKIFGQTFLFSPTIKPTGEGILKEVYTAEITIPSGIGKGKITDFGNIEYTAVYEGETITASGARIRGTGDDAKIAVEVLHDNSELKISESSWYYDDYTPASAGMREYAVSQSSGYYKLRFGGYIKDTNVKELENTEIAYANISSVETECDEKSTRIKFLIDENVPVNGYVLDGQFVFTLMNLNTDTAPDVSLPENPLFTDIRCEAHPTLEHAYKYYLTLVDIDNFYGFEFSYSDGYLTVSARNPQKLSESEKRPLEGKTIILDAGHGGNDIGATGPDKLSSESSINLRVVKSAEQKLIWLGANVILTRDDDSTVSIYDRLDLLCEINPDICISIHQNSMDYNVDITHVRGLLGLYFADSGKLLTKCLSMSISDALNKYMREPSPQRLAMVRNAKFPSTLIEASFITSVEEYDFLMSEAGIDSAAQGIADGVIEYYRQQEKYLGQ